MRSGETVTNSATERKGASQLHVIEIFTDTEGVIRVKGRLERSDLTFNEKQLIVLPKTVSFLSFWYDMCNIRQCTEVSV
ncbi:hypothetical protein HPB48_021178 [Haemaphysalis longicornis]|uniref:Uncharacterized protein n=1 Tax=Haemaphysalis longicornis TaxID=44386 RepID=A0A9J6FB06_HAELO|nr:hypothetical protein HPB48_021178 [Haemaphysalis longicornis]